MYRSCFYAILMLFSTVSFSQYFIPEMDNTQITLSKEAYAVTQSGDTIRGKVVSGFIAFGQLRSFTIKKEDGSKQKFKSPDVKVMAVKPNKLMNIESAMSVPNLRGVLKTDFNDVINREWVYFEQALLPKKKDKYVLMQLLNPGYDSKIKVYLDPNAKETKGVGIGGMKVIGGDDKSYLVVFDGNKSEVYKKGRYKKEAMSKLYKDCAVFTENYGEDKFKWKNFAEHVFVYDQLCAE